MNASDSTQDVPREFAAAGGCIAPVQITPSVETGVEREGSGRSSGAFCAKGVTLFLGDCREYLPVVADVLISDPPYGTGRYEHDDDVSVIEVLRAWPRRAFFGYPETLCEWCATLGRPDEWVTWWPTNKVTNNRAGLRRETEAVAIWGARYERPRRTRSTDSFARKISEQKGRDPETCEDGDLWRDPSPGVRSNSHLRQHPNEKPVSMMAKLVKLCSAEGETVFDPYMGSGSTGIAAVRHGRRFVGIEKDPVHFETAVRRIRAELAQGVLPLGGGGLGLGENLPTTEKQYNVRFSDSPAQSVEAPKAHE